MGTEEKPSWSPAAPGSRSIPRTRQLPVRDPRSRPDSPASPSGSTRASASSTPTTATATPSRSTSWKPHGPRWTPISSSSSIRAPSTAATSPRQPAASAASHPPLSHELAETVLGGGDRADGRGRSSPSPVEKVRGSSSCRRLLPAVAGQPATATTEGRRSDAAAIEFGSTRFYLQALRWPRAATRPDVLRRLPPALSARAVGEGFPRIRHRSDRGEEIRRL